MLRQMGTLLIERKDFFLGLLAEHLGISLTAILIAVVLGGLVGILISEFDRSAKPTLAVINFLYTIPSISMLGFLIPFSGVGNATAVIALTVYALLPMVRNTHTGIANVDPAILEAAKGMGSTRMQILIKVRLPLAMPVIMSGIRSMVTMTIALAGIASFIGAGGLGVAIYRGITTNNSAMTMAGSVLIAALALAVDFILGFVEKRMQKRSARARRTNRILGAVAAVICACLLITSLLGRQTGDTIRIATKPMTEQYVLGEMLKILIEKDTDLQVELTQGVGGGTSNIQPAMESGEFDLYPEYTGTAWNMVMKEEGLYTEQYNLKTYSDLARVSEQLVFGAEYDFFEREDGYDALCDTYGFHFKETMDLDIGLKYQAIDQGQIDVMVIFTTDGQLSASDVTVLEDDKQFYPSYLCGNVVRSEVLQEHPELEQIFEQVTGIISDGDMASMNYQVETEGREPEDVAEEFLESRGLL